MIVQWYPGHMQKAKREILELNKYIDLYLILLDARAPLSSRNEQLEALIKDKPKIYVLNKSDLADETKNQEFVKYFQENNQVAVCIDSLKGTNVKNILKIAENLLKDKIEEAKQKGRKKIIRFGVLGIPNVGKSTLINKITNSAKARTGDKPGVTRAKQWIKINDYFEMLDTPGILVPKLEDDTVALKLCAIGSIKEELFNKELVAKKTIGMIKKKYCQLLNQKYSIDFSTLSEEEYLIEIGKKRGCILKEGRIDTLKAATMFLDDLRKGKIGRITLDEVVGR
ncbi:ribosome biogenesis GTP-binding protein YlqF [Caldicellulosiruptor hydrothermalis 108]|uniref:Ribosome biogenesis GTPase A n=1 Tax=Caldicellulosiruptor hydrothermalis (strain DSM 18901 / VKM B-2411 / 108) TaxID=632292 RepID=E4QCQ5_CALH1|nr:ribosome biogenesis GTPase YlqF [Caldicellulosiruptor hydrothermalis]ADQ07472.1 ribosome biogenesis GTP-binding protein YlqF [Caldicellulosiruptor hydrothermalis 108]